MFGAIPALLGLLYRNYIPESPKWLLSANANANSATSSSSSGKGSTYDITSTTTTKNGIHNNNSIAATSTTTSHSRNVSEERMRISGAADHGDLSSELPSPFDRNSNYFKNQAKYQPVATQEEYLIEKIKQRQNSDHHAGKLLCLWFSLFIVLCFLIFYILFVVVIVFVLVFFELKYESLCN